MLRFFRRATAPALPAGLRTCAACGEPRGTTPEGQVSACFCSGAVCNSCGVRARRPMSDYYDRGTSRWWHVPAFRLMGHRCPEGTVRQPGRVWTIFPPDPDVAAYEEAITKRSLVMMRSSVRRRSGDRDHREPGVR